MAPGDRLPVAVHRRFAGSVPLEVMALETGQRLTSEDGPLLVLFDRTWDRPLLAVSWAGVVLSPPLAVSGPPALLRPGAVAGGFVAQAPSAFDAAEFLGWIEGRLAEYGVAMPRVRRGRGPWRP